MADRLANAQTPLAGEDVIVRAVQFFSKEGWPAQSQSSRVAIFVGRPKIPLWLPFVTVLGFLCLVFPGLLMCAFVIPRMIRFRNIVVTTTPIPGATDVCVTYPRAVKKLVSRFMKSLPPIRERANP